MPAKSPARAARALLIFGLSVVGVAVVWWLAYYSEWQGLGGLGLKFGCLSNDSADCAGLQTLIGSSAVPVYSPMLLWAGSVVALIGLYLSRRNKA
jgi:hypothetical protein